MVRESQSGRQSPLRPRTVRGEPYRVSGRTLVPVARVRSFGQAKGLIGKDRVSGRGAGFVFTSPLAMEVETADGQRHVAIRDRTTVALRGMFLAAAAMTVLFAVIRRLGRRKRGAGSE